RLGKQRYVQKKLFQWFVEQKFGLPKYLEKFEKAEVFEVEMLLFIDEDFLEKKVEMDNPVHRRKLFRKIEEFQIESNKFLNFIENNEVPPLHGVSHVLRANGFLSWELLGHIIHVQKDLYTVLDITNKEIVECLWAHLEQYKKDMTIPLPIKTSSTPYMMTSAHHYHHDHNHNNNNNNNNHLLHHPKKSQASSSANDTFPPPVAFKVSPLEPALNSTSSSLPTPSAPELPNNKGTDETDNSDSNNNNKSHSHPLEEEEFEGFYPIEGATTFQ
ncbi:hypothetical protein RFI_15344, partial [Reticulomyxa filosa]